MLVIRGTADFRSRVRGPALGDREEPTGALGDWFAKIRLWRPHLAVFVHRETYLPVLVPLAPASKVVDRFGEHLDSLLLALHAPPAVVAQQRSHRAEHHLAPTDDRSVVGVMNENLRMLDWWRHDLGAIDDTNVRELSLELPTKPVRAGSRTATWPDRAALTLLSD